MNQFCRIIIGSLLCLFLLCNIKIYVNANTRSDVQNKMIQTIYGGAGGYISCDFDSYKKTAGRHEGIDFTFKKGATVYSLTDGIVIRSCVPTGSLSTLSIYDQTNNKSVIYLHSAGHKVSVGQKVVRGQAIAEEGTKGCSSAHTHVEVRDGKHTHASKSVNDPVLNNSNPYPYWESLFNAGGDTTPPAITNVRVSDISSKGYTVSCTVKDNKGVDRVQFPTWTKKNDQDDIVKGWETAKSCSGTKKENTYTFKVKRSEHNNEYGVYTTHIYAYDKSGNPAKAVVPDVDLSLLPSAKVTQAAGKSTSSIEIKWGAVDKAVQYRIDRRSENGEYETIKTLDASADRTYTDKGLQAGKKYCYRVYTKNAIGWSVKNDGEWGRTLPDKTEMEKVTTGGTTKLQLQWKKVQGAASYIVKRSKAGESSYQDVKTVTGNTYMDTGLEAGCVYWYKVQTVNTDGRKGADSKGMSGITKFSAPTLTAKGADGFTVQWKKLNGGSGYQYVVYRKKSEDKNFTKVATTDQNSYADTGLEKGKQYVYKICLVKKDGGAQAADSEEATSGTIAVPGVPSIKVHNYDNGTLAISWEAVSGTTQYEVYRKAQGDSGFTNVKTTASTSYVDTKVSGGKKYSYYVTAKNSSGTSAKSNQVDISAALPAPNKVTCTAKSATSIEVTWTKVEGAAGYLIRRMKVTGGSDDAYEILVPYVETNSFTDTGLQPNTKYRYKIKTWTGNTWSDSSDQGNATTKSGTSNVPESPVITLKPKNTTTINISWKAVKGAKKYEVYRREAKEPYPDKPDYVTTGTSLDDTKLQAGTRYWYRVYAVNGDKKSPKPAGVMCYTYPDKPEVSLQTLSTSTVKVSWKKIQGAGSYMVDVRKSGDESYETVNVTESTSYVVGNLQAGTKYLFRVYAVVSDRQSYEPKIKSEKDAGKDATTKYDPKTCKHQYADWIVDRKATCTDKGSRHRICKLCEARETQDIQATGHSFDTNWTVLKQATCEENGAKCVVCKTCGARDKETVIKATGHAYENWVTEQAATCKAAGKRSRKCKNCTHKEYEVIPMLEHQYEVTERVEPTTDAAGKIQYTCKLCRGIYTEEIEKIFVPKVTGISLNKTSVVFAKAGESCELTAKVEAEDGYEHEIDWFCSDDSVIKLDSKGTVTSVAEGEAYVVVTTADGVFMDVCEVYVGDPSVREYVDEGGEYGEDLTDDATTESGKESEGGADSTAEQQAGSDSNIGTDKQQTGEGNSTESTGQQIQGENSTATEGQQTGESDVGTTERQTDGSDAETTERQTGGSDVGTTERQIGDKDIGTIGNPSEIEEVGTAGQPSENKQNDELVYKVILEAFTRQCQKGWDMETDFEWNPYGVSSENLFYLEDTSKLGYCFRDLDGDGVNELIISEDSDAEDGLIYEAYTCRNQKISQVLVSSFRSRYYLTADQTLRYEGSDSAFMSTFAQYQMLTDGSLQLVQAVICNGYANRSNPWFYSQTSADYDQAGTAVSITEAQAEQYKAGFKAADFTLKNFMDSTQSDGGQKSEEPSDGQWKPTGQVSTEQAGSQTGQMSTGQSGSQAAPAGQKTTEQQASQQIITEQRTTERTTGQSAWDGSQNVKKVQKENTPARFSLKNKKTYKKTKKLVIKDVDGIKTIKINGRRIKKESGKTKVSFKLSKYKKYFRKKGKWNWIVVTDMEGRSSSLIIKIK